MVDVCAAPSGAGSASGTSPGFSGNAGPSYAGGTTPGSFLGFVQLAALCLLLGRFLDWFQSAAAARKCLQALPGGPGGRQCDCREPSSQSGRFEDWVTLPSMQTAIVGA
jgi:hypothetical protein